VNTRALSGQWFWRKIKKGRVCVFGKTVTKVGGNNGRRVQTPDHGATVKRSKIVGGQNVEKEKPLVKWEGCLWIQGTRRT